MNLRQRAPCVVIAAAALAAAAVLCCPAIAREPAPATSDSAVPSAAEIAQWITELDSARYQEREGATASLLSAGAPAADALLAAANDQRPEPADRAVWILQQWAQSPDHDLALAALDRLVKLTRRPKLAEEARIARAEVRIARCRARLASLGAQLTTQVEDIDRLGAVSVAHVRLDEQWRGTADDLRELSQLDDLRCFRLEGAPVDDAAVKIFETSSNLALLQLFDTQVTPAAVDALKKRQPAAIVYIRNKALMGIAATSHADGVLVTMVQPGTGAALAGIARGDLIVSMEGRPLPDFDRLTARIAQHKPGDKIEVEILRGRQRLRKQITLGNWAMFR